MSAALHPDLVVLAEPQEPVGVDEEPRVSVRALPGVVPVDEHGGVAVDALELQRDPLAPVLLGCEERLAVLVRAAGEISVAAPSAVASRSRVTIAS